MNGKNILEEREQISEQEKLPMAIISIVALRAYTRALAKFDTRTYCGLGSRFWSGEPVLPSLKAYSSNGIRAR
jgi:hypothetical protein